MRSTDGTDSDQPIPTSVDPPEELYVSPNEGVAPGNPAGRSNGTCCDITPMLTSMETSSPTPCSEPGPAGRLKRSSETPAPKSPAAQARDTSSMIIEARMRILLIARPG